MAKARIALAICWAAGWVIDMETPKNESGEQVRINQTRQPHILLRKNLHHGADMAT
jgi:hypothetical protein